MSEVVNISPAALWATKGILRYTLHLPEPSPSNNEIKGMHFHVYKKERNAWQQRTEAALAGVDRLPPLQRSFLVIHRECCGGGLDWDNAYGGLKPLLDCLVAPSTRNPSGLGLIVDDNPSNMPFPPFVKQLSAKRGQGKTTVSIYELVD